MCRLHGLQAPFRSHLFLREMDPNLPSFLLSSQVYFFLKSRCLQERPSLTLLLKILPMQHTPYSLSLLHFSAGYLLSSNSPHTGRTFFISLAFLKFIFWLRWVSAAAGLLLWLQQGYSPVVVCNLLTGSFPYLGDQTLGHTDLVAVALEVLEH